MPLCVLAEEFIWHLVPCLRYRGHLEADAVSLRSSGYAIEMINSLIFNQYTCPAPILWAIPDQSFGDRRTHVQGLMGAGVVVLLEPAIDDDLRLFCRGEPLGVEDLAAEGSVEPFIVAVLPR